MKIVTSQLNYTVGAFEKNASKIKSVIAGNLEADWIVFSELSISGYYPKDLINVKGFYDAQQDALNTIIAETKGSKAKVVLGLITKNIGTGKKWHNSLVVIQDGAICMDYSKQLLPTYDVFDEARHFEPGKPTTAIWREAGKPTVGLIICEDGWNDLGLNYKENPTEALREENIDILITINASPSAQKKTALREALMQDLAKKYSWSIVYVNQVGGADALIFDGNSFICNADGKMAYHAKSYAEETRKTVYNTEKKKFELGEVFKPEEEIEETYKALVLGTADYFKKTGNGFKTAIIGSSGGIDSAVVETIAVDALGAQNVVGLTLPSKYSSGGSVSHSLKLAENLGIVLHEIPIQEPIDQLQAIFTTTSLGKVWSGVALENAQARMRGLILMGWANQLGALVLSTGNKSEMSVGYATLYGDMNGALNPLGDLYKMDVYALAKWINKKAGFARIPIEIIEKAPSAELAEGQKDEDSLPPYPVLDAMLKIEIEGALLTESELASCEKVIAGYDAERKDVRKKLEMAEFKRQQAPLILRVNQRAFGDGWVFPLAQQYRGWERK